MRIPVLRHGQIAALACGIGLIGAFLAAMPSAAVALHPKSPDVMAAIDKGVTFLMSDAANDDRIGARALQGMCIMKHTAKSDHPKVLLAVDRIAKAIGDRDPTKLEAAGFDIYSTGIAIIFLVEHDKEKHRADIDFLMAHLYKRQKPCGGWGYEGRDTGDTSMTQYGVLSSWIAKRAGLPVPQDKIEAVSTWLMRTQDPSGGFGYQGVVAPNAGALVPQSEIRPSMSAAASGSLYICADMLDLIEVKEKRKDLPSALKEVKSKEPPKDKIKTTIEVKAIRETEARAKQWLEANSKLEGVRWVHYYLYALERCMAFRELFDQRFEEEPRWYNEGAEFLMKSQAENGGWPGECGATVDTSFSVMFLMRNTRKIVDEVKRYDGGVMDGGVGIPKDTTRVIRKPDGRLEAQPLSGSSAELIAAIEKPGGVDFEKKLDLLAQLPGDELEALAAKHGNQIRDLVGNKSPEARLAAVMALSKTRNLDNAETLIYALTDPDFRVVRAANDGLLRMRRTPLGPALPETFSDEDRRFLVEKWKAWYQTIRPGVDMR